MYRSRGDPGEEGLSSMVSEPGNKRQRVEGKIDIADRASYSPVIRINFRR